MKRKSITKRFILAYALSTLTILLGAVMLYFALNNSYVLVESMADVYSPSTQQLQKLSFEVGKTKMLIKGWVFVSPQTNFPDKIRLKHLQEKEIPELFKILDQLSKKWEPKEQQQLKLIEDHFINRMLPAQRKVMNLLSSYEDYENQELIKEAKSLVADKDDEVMNITNDLVVDIGELMMLLSGKAEEVKIQAKKSMNAFKLLIIFIALAIGLGTLLLASFINRSVMAPLKELDKAASLVQRGNLDIQVKIKQNNEIGSLTDNFNQMIQSLKKQKEELEEYTQLLQKSRKNLKATNKTKDKFFNILAHDLKGPFTSFIAITDVLSKDPDSLNEEQKMHFLKSLNNSAVYLERLLENLLQWARTQSGTLEVNLQCVEVYDIVKQNLKIISINAENKKITLQNKVEKEVGVLADPNLLNTIFRNLISNAVKYTQEGGEVAVSSKKWNDQMIAFTVQDNGMGIAEEDQEKLFRIETNSKTIGESTEKGTGFGLILCKDFVETLGGEIFVESQLGKGSSFQFILPSC